MKHLILYQARQLAPECSTVLFALALLKASLAGCPLKEAVTWIMHVKCKHAFCGHAVCSQVGQNTMTMPSRASGTHAVTLDWRSSIEGLTWA